MKDNPIINSLAEIKRIEINEEIRTAYDEVKEELGDNFDSVMADLALDITALQHEAKKEISFGTAGLLLLLPTETTDQDDEEFKRYTRMVRSAIGWGIQHGLNDD